MIRWVARTSGAPARRGSACPCHTILPTTLTPTQPYRMRWTRLPLQAMCCMVWPPSEMLRRCTMRAWTKSLLVFTIALLLPASGCKEEHIDKAREAAEKGAEKAKDTAEKVTEEVGPAVEKAKKATTQAIEDARRATTQAVEDAKPYVKKVKTATTQAVEKAKPYANAAKKATTQAVERVKEKVEELTDDD